MSDRPASQMLSACKLWEKTSANGNTYLVGRLGGVKVLILKNHRRENETENTHVMMFAEATQTAPRSHEQAAPGNGASYPASPRRPSSARGGPREQIPDDPLPF